MDVRRGYKKTGTGTIPEDWNVCGLGEIAKLEVGFAFKSSWFQKDGGVPLLRGENVGYGRPDWSDLRTLTTEQAKTFRDYDLCPGDIVIGMDRTFTKSGVKVSRLREEDCPSLLVQRVGRFIPVACDWDFLWALVSSSQFLDALKGEQKGMDIPHLSRVEILNPLVAVPRTRAEQNAIASGLGDANALIESLEQLLAKKRQIKQGAMRELLTGKRRLPGFRGEWRTRVLGEVIRHCSSGATPYRGKPEHYRGRVNWITSGELNYNIIMETIEHISDEAVQETNLMIHPVGTFLIAITGLEAAGTRGSCGIVGRPAATNQSCMAIYPSADLVAPYLFHYYTFRGNELALRYCQGTKQQSYTAKLVKLLPIEMPPTTEEQTAIAETLSGLDNDIATLSDMLSKARQIKQAMMQELLTGRIRLVDARAPGDLQLVHSA